jgi:transposase
VTTSAVPASGAWQARARYCRGLGEGRDRGLRRLENKVSLGFVEGLNNKIRVIQRRAHGLRNEEYPRLKILTCMLPAL